MKLDYSSDNLAFLDFETQSEADLKRGVRHYVTHPSTRVLTCVVKAGSTVHTFGPYLDKAEQQRLLRVTDGRVVVAHNAPFDEAVWTHVLKLPPVLWRDTLPCARAAGLPGALDKLSLALGGRGKDKNGSRLIDMLCILRPGKPVPAVGLAHKLLMDYNIQDVEELEYIHSRVRRFGEPEVIQVDRDINDRGIPVDRNVLEKLRDLFVVNAREQRQSFADTTRDPDTGETVMPTSPKQVLIWLSSMGFPVGSVSKPTVLSLLSRPEEFYTGDEGDMSGALDVVRDALLARKDVVSVGRSKVDTALEILDADDRIRDQVVYYGAHTGRWSGRRLQPHNMPSNVGQGVDIKTVPLTYEAMKAATDAVNAKLPPQERVPTSYLLSTAIRTAVRADNLLVCDYASVETRGLAWVADEEVMLDIYRDPKRSLYIDMGKVVFGRELDKKNEFVEYQLCKAIILGCGYSMSGGKFAATLATRNISVQPLVDAGLTPQDCVKVYRSTYPKVPMVWTAYHAAVHSAVNGVPVETGRCKFLMVDGDLHAVLPSGRPIVYRNARIEMLVPGYCKMYNMPEIPVPTVVYDGPRHKGFLYGGKVCENVVQGLCRDLMAEALVRCQQVGLHPVLHVHDEIVCEDSPDKFRELLQLMSDPPKWADGFPLMVEGYSGPIWTKQPDGYIEGKAIMGRVL